jgi:hypothetical protein
MAMIFTDGTNPTTNQTPSTTGEAHYILMLLLLQAGWTHWASGDGTNASSPSIGSNTPATPNRITSAAVMATNNAYFVLRDLEGKRLLGFQRTTSPTVWRYKYVPATAAGAVQNVFTAGTGSVMPLFADASDTGSKYLAGNLASGVSTIGSSGYRQSCGADNVTGAFYVIRWQTVNQSPDGGFVFDRLANSSYPAQDLDPYVIYTPGNGAGVFDVDNMYQDAEDGSVPRGFLRKDMSREAFVGFAACQLGITRLYPSQAGANPLTLKEDGVPIFYLRRAARTYPVGWKGMSSLMRWNSTTRPTGQALTKTALRDRICIGDVNVPWDGSSVSL